MKLIKPSTDHYIVVDDSEIKEGDWVFNEKSKEIYPITIIEEVVYYEKKITHSTEPLEDYTRADGKKIKVYVGINPLNLFEVKELTGEVDVEQYAWDNPVLSRKDVYTLFNEVFRDKTIEGAYRISASKQIYEFNTKLRELAKQKALEDNKDRKYTEEDMQWALHHAKYHQELTIEQIIEALHQPKTEWEVEIVDGKLKLKQ